MAKIKLTKTELKAQNDALKRFQRFLPMLQLKKQQLQSEIAGISAKADAVIAKENEFIAEMSSWVELISDSEQLLSGLVKIREIKCSKSNIAGVEIPVFEGVDIDIAEIDVWFTPAWITEAVSSLSKILTLKCERQVLVRQRELIEEELTVTSQRVNLFEKVMIPQCKENIRVIRIAIGDEQTAAVTRGKIAKSRTPESEDAA